MESTDSMSEDEKYKLAIEISASWIGKDTEYHKIAGELAMQRHHKITGGYSFSEK